MRRHELALRLANAQSVKRTYLSKLEKAPSYSGREIIAKLVAVPWGGAGGAAKARERAYIRAAEKWRPRERAELICGLLAPSPRGPVSIGLCT